MSILNHRLRCLARIAGPERVAQLDRFLFTEPAQGRALLEANHPDRVASALMRFADFIGMESEAHARRLAAWSRQLGAALHLPSGVLADLERYALVHDIGKLTTPDEVLQSPLPLEPTWLDRIHLHPTFGQAVLFRVGGYQHIARWVQAHHEYFDGSGYPDGLVGTEIPLAARVFCLVDSFDAMTRGDRPFRTAQDAREAADELKALAGVRYDPPLVEAFLRQDFGAWCAVRERWPDTCATPTTTAVVEVVRVVESAASLEHASK